MTYTHTLVFYQTVTPLHVGCGQDVGVVDLPVIRERTTGYPFVPGSGIRGAVREVLERAEGELAKLEEPTPLSVALFGPELADGQGELASGCVAVHDAKLLFFPVRSDHEVFLWITCPFVLERFTREVGVFVPGLRWGHAVAAGETPGDEEFLAAFSPNPPSLYLEEHAVSRFSHDRAEARLVEWVRLLSGQVGRPDLGRRWVLVSDRTFGYFVEHATQVQQHVRLSPEKTVVDGALFSVEAVPPEALFYGFLGGTEVRHPRWLERKEPAMKLEALVRLRQGLLRGAGSETYLTLGGDEGTGLGVTRLVWKAEG